MFASFNFGWAPFGADLRMLRLNGYWSKALPATAALLAIPRASPRLEQFELEMVQLEFRDAALERTVGLTPADRKWMDEVVTDVNKSWDKGKPDSGRSVHFKGSNDYLRQKASCACSCTRFAADGLGQEVMALWMFVIIHDSVHA